MVASDRDKVTAIMKRTALHAFLATCDGEAPVVRSVSSIVGDDMTLWVTTHANANKVEHVLANPRVCLLFVEFPNGDSGVTVQGVAALVPDASTRKKVWDSASFDLFQHFPGGPDSQEFAVLRITPHRIVWRESWEGGNKVLDLAA